MEDICKPLSKAEWKRCSSLLKLVVHDLLREREQEVSFTAEEKSELSNLVCHQMNMQCWKDVLKTMKGEIHSYADRVNDQLNDMNNDVYVSGFTQYVEDYLLFIKETVDILFMHSSRHGATNYVPNLYASTKKYLRDAFRAYVVNSQLGRLERVMPGCSIDSSDLLTILAFLQSSISERGN